MNHHARHFLVQGMPGPSLTVLENTDRAPHGGEAHRLGRLAVSIVDGVSGFTGAIASLGARHDLRLSLERLSDERLADMGLERRDIGRVVDNALPLPGAGLASLLAAGTSRAVRAVARARARRRLRATLENMNDERLDDIGVVRADIDRIVARAYDDAGDDRTSLAVVRTPAAAPAADAGHALKAA